MKHMESMPINGIAGAWRFQKLAREARLLNCLGDKDFINGLLSATRTLAKSEGLRAGDPVGFPADREIVHYLGCFIADALDAIGIHGENGLSGQEGEEGSVPAGGYLGIHMDHRNRKVHREGYSDVEFKGKAILWKLLEELVDAEGEYCSLDDLWATVWENDRPAWDTDKDNMRAAVCELRKQIAPIVLLIENSRGLGHILSDDEEKNRM